MTENGAKPQQTLTLSPEAIALLRGVMQSNFGFPAGVAETLVELKRALGL